MLVLLVAACHRKTTTGSPPAEVQRPLAGFATQRLIVTPTSRVRAADSLGWVQQLGGVQATARKLDSAITTALTDRGLAARWVLPAELQRSYERNRSYASDPYQLSVEQVRSSTFEAGLRYGDPLATQLRTMIALHEDVRYVLMPIEMRFDRNAAGGFAVLHAALMDPRSTEAKWVGDLKGPASLNGSDAMTRVAVMLADLFVAP
jgi:hypothetical protein